MSDIPMSSNILRVESVGGSAQCAVINIVTQYLIDPVTIQLGYASSRLGLRPPTRTSR